VEQALTLGFRYIDATGQLKHYDEPASALPARKPIDAMAIATGKYSAVSKPWVSLR